MCKRADAHPPLRDLALSFAALSADDAFASRHMSDLGEEVDDFRVFRWAIKDYHTLDKRTHSPEFHCGGHIWYAGLSVPASLVPSS